MKYFHAAFFAIIFYVSCNGQGNKENTIMQTNPYKTEKRTIYGMDLTIPGPYELYINDIASRKDYGAGMHNTFIEINPYVLKSGKYSFVLKLFPMPSELSKGGIQPSTIELLKVAVSKYEKKGDQRQSQSFEKLNSYPTPKLNTPVPFYEIKGEFTVDLPYELEGWSNGQDLSKMDKDELEKKVVDFYEKSRVILNNGDADTWEKMTQRRINETYVFNYTDEKTKNETKQEEVVIVKEKTKNNMQPIVDYEMYLYGNNKLVCLERIGIEKLKNSNTNPKGWSPLIRNYNNVNTSTGILLYLPQNSNEFVIIRK